MTRDKYTKVRKLYPHLRLPPWENLSMKAKVRKFSKEGLIADRTRYLLTHNGRDLWCYIPIYDRPPIFDPRIPK